MLNNDTNAHGASIAQNAIIVALDCDRTRALELADMLSGHALWVKVGMTLFYREGPRIVHELKERGFKVFLDLKLHDIPHQVEGACTSALLCGADIISIHGLGGKEMMRAAVRAKQAQDTHASSVISPKIIAISVLTSMNDEALHEIGVDATAAHEAQILAELACAQGVDGMVCSAFEARKMRELFGSQGLIVCPGIRMQGNAHADQARVATPSFAREEGASMIVVGRPITEADDPVLAYKSIARAWSA